MLHWNHHECTDVHACWVFFCHVSLWPYGSLPAGFLCPWDSQGQNARAGCHALLQEIFWTQGWNPCLLHLLHLQAGSLLLAHLGSPKTHWQYFQKCQHIKALSSCCFHGGHLLRELRPSLELDWLRRRLDGQLPFGTYLPTSWRFSFPLSLVSFSLILEGTSSSLFSKRVNDGEICFQPLTGEAYRFID